MGKFGSFRGSPGAAAGTVAVAVDSTVADTVAAAQSCVVGDSTMACTVAVARSVVVVGVGVAE